jgi:hypothetical protein
VQQADQHAQAGRVQEDDFERSITKCTSHRSCPALLHVTPETKKRILDVLTARWEASLLALRAQEQVRLIALLPQMEQTIRAARQAAADQGSKIIAQISPMDA